MSAQDCLTDLLILGATPDCETALTVKSGVRFAAATTPGIDAGLLQVFGWCDPRAGNLTSPLWRAQKQM